MDTSTGASFRLLPSHGYVLPRTQTEKVPSSTESLQGFPRTCPSLEKRQEIGSLDGDVLLRRLHACREELLSSARSHEVGGPVGGAAVRYLHAIRADLPRGHRAEGSGASHAS